MLIEREKVASSQKEYRVRTFGYHFQPIVKIDRSVVGFEALARCHTNPGVALNMCDSSLIEFIDFDTQVKEFCKSVGIICKCLGQNYRFSFNINPVKFDVKAVNLLADTCINNGFSPSIVDIELIETNQIDFCKQTFETAKNRGFKLVLDDFGVGYSNVETVLSYPFDKIKFDKIFLNSDCCFKRSLFEALHDAFLKRGLETVVEGVETTKMLSSLNKIRPSFLQGWLFGEGTSADMLVQIQ